LRYLEQKYQVQVFTDIITKLKKLNAKHIYQSDTIHYYGMPEKDEKIIKLVEYSDHTEIHKLRKQKQQFKLTEKESVKNKLAGLQVLKANGFIKVAVVTMHSDNYEYEDGLVRLYTIDNWLFSVILDFPSGVHTSIAKKLGLKEKDIIATAYNKQLELLGKLNIQAIASFK